MKRLILISLTLCLLLPLLCSLLLASCDSEQHEHTYHYSYNASTHQKIYTCGCPSPDIAEVHLDDDGDGACDACGYGMSVAIPDQPLRSLAGCEWLAELYLEDIAEIKMISQEGMVAPGCFKYISRSNNVHSIANLHGDLLAITVTQVSEEETQICDGGTVTVFFTLKDGTVHRILLNNGQFYQDAHGNHFEISHLPSFRDGDEHINCYAFESDSGVGTILERSAGSCEWYQIGQFPLDELEFVEFNTDLDLPDVIRDEYVHTDFGTLRFITAEHFYLDVDGLREITYQLVGKDLDELISEYSGLFDE